MENGSRIEAKLDRLLETVAQMRQDLAKYSEKTDGLEKRFDDYLSHGRIESCPLRVEHPLIIQKLDKCIALTEAHDSMLDRIHEEISDIKSRFRFMRWLTLGCISLVTTAGAVVGLLAALHVI